MTAEEKPHKKSNGRTGSLLGFAHRKPPKETSLHAGKNHPQRALMIERERSRPASCLEAWFDAGLVKEKLSEDEERKKKKHQGMFVIKGSRPLPIGYLGCDGKKDVMVKAANSGVLVWPLRADVGEVGADHQPPWTLYHYCPEASFEKFHQLFHNLSTHEPNDVRKTVYDLLQLDFQERVPNPTPQNVKGEPQLSPMEPCKFASKEEILTHMFGKYTAGFSKYGNAWTSFADYCIAIRVPVSACFTINSHGAGASSTGANVRICKDTLHMMAARMERTRELARLQHGQETAHHAKGPKKGASDSPSDAAKTGCFGRFCGSRQPPPEFWDDAPVQEKKKEKREVDRWKQRLAKQWMNDHVNQVARNAHAEKARRSSSSLRSNSTVHSGKKKKKVGLTINERVEVKLPKMFDSPLAIFNRFSKSLRRPENKSTRDNAAIAAEAREVEQASNLFAGQSRKKGSRADLDHEVGTTADSKIKQQKRVNKYATMTRAPQGTKRADLAKNKEMRALAAEIEKDDRLEQEQMETDKDTDHDKDKKEPHSPKSPKKKGGIKIDDKPERHEPHVGA